MDRCDFFLCHVHLTLCFSLKAFSAAKSGDSSPKSGGARASGGATGSGMGPNSPFQATSVLINCDGYFLCQCLYPWTKKERKNPYRLYLFFLIDICIFYF